MLKHRMLSHLGPPHSARPRWEVARAGGARALGAEASHARKVGPSLVLAFALLLPACTGEAPHSVQSTVVDETDSESIADSSLGAGSDEATSPSDSETEPQEKSTAVGAPQTQDPSVEADGGEDWASGNNGQTWANVAGVTGVPTADVWAQWEALAVQGRAPKAGYSRDQFGQRWKDVDRNGCDQRNDILARDMTQVNAPKGCKVLSGVLHDPFTGKTINFQRGQGTSNAVQIDHMVPLADAWQKGAQNWTPEQREQFANDPMNLLAVDGPQNQKKSAGDAATWLPPNKDFRCQYAATQVRVKHDYGLWVTQAEKDAMARELGRCGETIG